MRGLRSRVAQFWSILFLGSSLHQLRDQRQLPVQSPDLNMITAIFCLAPDSASITASSLKQLASCLSCHRRAENANYFVGDTRKQCHAKRNVNEVRTRSGFPSTDGHPGQQHLSFVDWFILWLLAQRLVFYGSCLHACSVQHLILALPSF